MRSQSYGGPIISQVLPKSEVWPHKKLERKIDLQQNQIFIWTLQRLCYNTCFLRKSSQNLSSRGTAKWGRLVSHCWWSRLGSTSQQLWVLLTRRCTPSIPRRLSLLERKQTGNSRLQCKVHLKKKAYNEGIMKIQGIGCFSASQASRKHKVEMEKGNRITLDFFQKQH